MNSFKSSEPNAFSRRQYAERIDLAERTRNLRVGKPAGMRSVRSNTSITSFVSNEDGSKVIELSHATTNGERELFIHRYPGLQLTESDFETLYRWASAEGFSRVWVQARAEGDLPPEDNEEPLPDLLEAIGPRSGEPVWSVVTEEAGFDSYLLREASNADDLWDFPVAPREE